MVTISEDNVNEYGAPDQNTMSASELRREVGERSAGERSDADGRGHSLLNISSHRALFSPQQCAQSWRVWVPENKDFILHAQDILCWRLVTQSAAFTASLHVAWVALYLTTYRPLTLVFSSALIALGIDATVRYLKAKNYSITFPPEVPANRR